jgi:hypothetical protein
MDSLPTPCASPWVIPTPPLDVAATIAAGEALIRALPGVVSFALIGSASYLPEEANDVDFAVLIAPPHDAMGYTGDLASNGWGRCGEYDTRDGNWAAVRRDYLNFMVTHDPAFFERYKVATEVCKALKLRNKAERIAVCQIVRDGKTATEVRL